MKEEKSYLIHPNILLLYLLITAITLLFLGFCFSYLYNRIDQDIPPVALPSLFYFNTVLLILSSNYMNKATDAFKTDDAQALLKGLIIAALLSLLFLLMQVLAWRQLIADEIFVNYSNLASYMYLVSGVHLAHIIIGLPFLFNFIKRIFLAKKSSVDSLMFFSSADNHRTMKMLEVYWHYLDLLWIFLVLFFLANYIIS